MTPTKTQLQPEEDPTVEATLTESTPLSDVKAALSSRYEIVENLGKGEFCTVYRAIDRRSNIEVALEILPPHLAQNTDYVSRFHREASIASRLNNRNISKIYDEGVHNGVHFVTVEYLDGLDLHTMIMWKGRLDAKEAVKIISPCVEALAYAHEKGLIHRDLRSSNIIITDVGRPVMTDFWIDHSSRGTKLAGALEYMSPEEVEGKELTRSSNIYCFGIILYEALTGKVPFFGPNPFEIVGKIIGNPPVFPRKIASTIPDWMEEITLRCLEKNPKNRFSSAAELAAALLRSKAPAIVSQPVSQRPTISHASSKTKSKPPAPRETKKTAPSPVVPKLTPPDKLFGSDKDKKIVKEKAEAEKKKFEAEKERVEAEKKRVEAEKERVEAEKKKVEAEKERVEAEKRKAEAEKERIEAEKRKAEAEKKKIEAEKERVEAEKRRAGVEAEKRKGEVRKKKVEVQPSLERKIDKLVVEVKKEPKTRVQIKSLIRIAIPLAFAAAVLIVVISNPSFLHHGGQNQNQAVNDENVSEKITAIPTPQAKESGFKSVEAAPNEESGKTPVKEIEPLPAVVKSKPQNTTSTVRIVSLSKAKSEEAENVAVANPSKAVIPAVKMTVPENVVPKISVINIQWIYVDSGSFLMGSNSYPSTKPVHSVKVSSYYMSATEITFDQYDKFCELTNAKKPDDNGWGRGKMPVINVSWNDAVAFCRWVSDQTGKMVRLPTEAEFEFAARGGNKNESYAYSGNNSADLVAWYADNSSGRPHVVGTKQPNELGLYDMSGNVWEWCEDWYHQSYDGAPVDGKMWNVQDRYNPYRVLRGGSANGANYCSQVSFRFWLAPFFKDKAIGFRVVKEVK